MLLTNIISGKLQQLSPIKLEVINESARHAGHDDATDESHFSILIISNNFIGITLLERHRMVKNILKEELKSKIHALSLKTLTEEEYQKSLSKL